jgi:hypothetical protein
MSTIISACPICSGAMDLAMSDVIAFVVHIQNCHAAGQITATMRERERCAGIAAAHKKQLADHKGCCSAADAAQGIENEIRMEIF